MIQLALKFRIRCTGIMVPFMSGLDSLPVKPLILGYFFIKPPSMWVERAVLHHEDDDVFEVI